MNSYWQRVQLRRQMTRRRLIQGSALAGAGLAAATLVGCGGDEGDGGGSGAGLTARIGVASDCGSPDFHSVAGSGGGNWVCNLGLTEGLLQTNRDNGLLQPWLAESYEVTDAGLSRTYKLRKGITFQNGEPFDATSVKFAYERLMGLAAYNKAYKAGSGPTFLRLYNNATPVTVIDPYTVRINLLQLDVTATGSTSGASGLVPPKYLEQVGDDGFAKAPISTGPMKFVERRIGEDITFERYEQYWNKDGHVKGGGPFPAVSRFIHKIIPEDETRISALRVGEVDLMVNVPATAQDRLSKDSSVKLVFVPGTQPMHLQVNSTAEVNPDTGAPNPFRDVRVRQAMNYAIDLNKIIKEVLTGREGKTQMITSDTLGFDPKTAFYYSYDVAKAKQLMSAAGFANGVPGDYWITNPTGRWQSSDQISQVIASYFAAVGIKTTVRAAEYQVVTSGLQNHTMWPFAFWGMSGGREPSATAGGFRNSAQTNARAGITAGGQYGINAPDPEIDALITKYIETVDDKAREAIGLQVGKLFYDRAYWVFLHEPVTIFATSSKWTWQPTQFASTTSYEFREIKRA